MPDIHHQPATADRIIENVVARLCQERHDRLSGFHWNITIKLGLKDRQ